MTTENAAGKWHVIDWEKHKDMFVALNKAHEEDDDEKYFEILEKVGYDGKNFVWENFLHINLPIQEKEYLVEDDNGNVFVAEFDGTNTNPIFWVYFGESEIIDVVRWAEINQ